MKRKMRGRPKKDMPKKGQHRMPGGMMMSDAEMERMMGGKKGSKK